RGLTPVMSRGTRAKHVREYRVRESETARDGGTWSQSHGRWAVARSHMAGVRPLSWLERPCRQRAEVTVESPVGSPGARRLARATDHAKSRPGTADRSGATRR